MIHYSSYKYKCFPRKDTKEGNGTIEIMKAAILGFGTVGSGAFEALKSSDDVCVKRVLARHPIEGMEEYVTTDMDDILGDSEIDIVAECIGGEHPALDYVKAAMRSGKHVVTPNKNLVSAHYEELMSLAKECGVQFRFTPTAGGGTPWLFNLQRQARCDEIMSVSGIVNGSCNYILDRMQREGAGFDEILADAQKLGYAEKDPSADIRGFDTQRKCVISANTAFGCSIHEEDVPVFGIDKIRSIDIDHFREKGYTCRLMMNASRIEGTDSISAYVEPVLVPPGELAASVPLNNNLIFLTGRNIGTLAFYGQGAGKMPTGTSLAEDMIDIADRSIPTHKAMENHLTVDNTRVFHRYYMRDGDKIRITNNMTVRDAHAFAAKHAGGFFMAGIMEN
jgi:homoserine dehydrogenase